MKRYAPIFALACLARAAAWAADAPQGPAPGVPELQVLNHWMGTWDDEMTTKPNAGLPQGMHGKGPVVAEWVLDGRFLQQSATLKPDGDAPATKVTTMMTYDPERKVYRSWMFFSSGVVRECVGRWDEKTRTMTSLSRDGERGATMTITATFGDDGAETWTIVEKDRDAKILAEISGKSTPHKK